MSTRRATRIALLILLILIGFVVYRYYANVRPMLAENAGQTQTISLQKHQEIAFGKDKNMERVSGIQVEITGHSDSNLDVVLSNGKTLMHVAAVKGEKLHFMYQNAWTDDSCFVRISPQEAVGGKLKITCRFLSED
jgi:hypothetical protein